MAEKAILLDRKYTYSAPSFTFGLWKFEMLDSTAFVEIELKTFCNPIGGVCPDKNLWTNSYSIDIKSLSISCDSTSYNFSLLVRDNVNLRNTLYEVAAYEFVDKSTRDNFSSFVCSNRDEPIRNKIYLWLSDNAVHTFLDVYFELVYTSLQDREF